MFEKVNITPLGIKILLFLARNPEKEFYLREIAKTINNSVGGTHKVLKSLDSLNLINYKRSGKNLYYKINQKNPSIKSFKIFMTINELNELVNNLKDISSKIILFGSCATGDDTLDSDIDLFVLTINKDEVKKKIKRRKLTRNIQAIVINSTEFLKIKEKDKAFYKEIKKGIKLWDEHNDGI
jgi:predicted nucleotidyltransferase